MLYTIVHFFTNKRCTLSLYISAWAISALLVQTGLGNAKASRSGTSNWYRFPRFFFLYGLNQSLSIRTIRFGESLEHLCIRMKTYFSVLFFCLSCCLLSSCGNDDEIKDLNERVDGLTQRVEVLENWCKETNTNIQSLQTLVQSLIENDMVTSVIPVKNGDEVIGYTISFLKSAPITIYHGENGIDGKDGVDGADGENGIDGKDGVDGENGKDGYTPVIGVKQDKDGIYYWTLDGEWLLGAESEKVKAQGEDGEDGKNGYNGSNGLTPQLKIGEDGYWYVSYGGSGWTQLSDMPANVGNDIFSKVTVEEDKIVFVLSDGTEIVIPINKMIKITFGESNKGQLSGIAANEVIYIPYTLANATENTLVTASSDGNYKVKVERKSQNSGQIVVTAPSEYVDGFVNVHIYNGNGYTSVHVINFYHQQMIFSNGQEYLVSAEGQTIQVPVKVNFNYTVSIPSTDSWVSLAESRSADFRDETLTFTLAANPDKAARSASIGIVAENAKEPLYYITFNQASSFFSIDKTHFSVDATGETLTVQIYSSLGLDVKGVADWITSWDVTSEGTLYTLTLNVPANDTDTYRINTIQLYENETLGSILLGEIEIIQNSQTSDELKNMVFEVLANPANDYTVALPLYENEYDRDDQLDCYVDWGDGTKDYVTDKYPFHTYDGLTEPKRFVVTISGKVPALYAFGLTSAEKSSIKAVKQWGITGLKSMERAFEGCLNLESVAADNTMAFKDVEYFSFSFSDCINLTSEGLSADLFKHAVKGIYFRSVFKNCSSLTTIPESLFNNSIKAKDFSDAFRSTAISSIPENLFANCHDIEYFSNTFGECESLIVIPENLFTYCEKVKDFEGVFYSCIGLKSIPVKLFANCPNVENFGTAFARCENLQTIPVNIFDNNKKVIDFGHVFRGCGNIEGESPYTFVDGEKVHLYERMNYRDYFVTPTSFNAAFSSCLKLSDYSNIPENWK